MDINGENDVLISSRNHSEKRYPNRDTQIRKKHDDIKHALRKLEGVLEVAALVGLYYLVWKHFYQSTILFSYYGRGRYVLAGIYAFLVFFLFLYCDSFKFGYLKLTDIFISQYIAVLIVNFVSYFQLCVMAKQMINVLPILLLSGIDLAAVFICTYLFTRIYHHFFAPWNMVMVYGADSAMQLKLKMDIRQEKYHISKLLPVELGYKKICEEILHYDAVVINEIPAQIRNDILKFCFQNGIRTYVAPKLSDIIIRGAEGITLFDTPLILVKNSGLSFAQRMIKRAMDLVLCGIAMIPGIVLIAAVAIAIRLEDGGPVFYRQERVTINGKKFNILKFRSMIVDAEKEGRSIPATDHDPRITKVGRIIRATRIDEFPQILNILKGDMSIVGPRPERTEHVEKYSKEIPEFAYRLKVKGGLTGLAQVYGKYNTSAYDKLRLDLMYIENYSLLTDIRLILLTLRIMFKPESTEGFDKIIDLEAAKEIAVTSEKADKQVLGRKNEEPETCTEGRPYI